jgi:hypothetical protein
MNQRRIGHKRLRLFPQDCHVQIQKELLQEFIVNVDVVIAGKKDLVFFGRQNQPHDCVLGAFGYYLDLLAKLFETAWRCLVRFEDCRRRHERM